jgi:hypothetical protein
MDVTDQIIQINQLYGGSDNTSQNYTASGRCLNYARKASIQNPEVDRVTTIPRALKYQDAVGLFGSENHFVKVQLKIQNPVTECYDDPGYQCATLSADTFAPDDPYTTPNQGEAPGAAYINIYADLETVNTYDPAGMLGNTIPNINTVFVRVDLNNLRTGNHYIDNWFDVRLYYETREEHPYDVMYVHGQRYFYIGFHARNTKRLPYNVECAIGKASDEGNDGILFQSQVDPRLLAKTFS